MTLRDRLPDIRGTYAEAAPMARHTWFGVGGPADMIFCPRDADDLAGFLASCPADIPCCPSVPDQICWCAMAGLPGLSSG